MRLYWYEVEWLDTAGVLHYGNFMLETNEVTIAFQLIMRRLREHNAGLNSRILRFSGPARMEFEFIEVPDRG